MAGRVESFLFIPFSHTQHNVYANKIFLNHSFGAIDLYLAYCASFAYGMLYMFVYDRIGVHLYPIFTPRKIWGVASWFLIVIFYLGGLSFCNWFMANLV